MEVVAARPRPVATADQEQVLDLARADHAEQRVGHAHHRVAREAGRDHLFRRVLGKSGQFERAGDAVAVAGWTGEQGGHTV